MFYEEETCLLDLKKYSIMFRNIKSKLSEEPNERDWEEAWEILVASLLQPWVSEH